jgi:hypothetical protein
MEKSPADSEEERRKTEKVRRLMKVARAESDHEKSRQNLKLKTKNSELFQKHFDVSKLHIEPVFPGCCAS